MYKITIMPEMQKKIKKEIEALPKEIKVKIEDRFTDLSALTDDIAGRVSKNIPFPEALVDAVREKDPELAKEIEQQLKPPEEKEPEVSAPEIEAETSVTVKGGITPGGPVAEVEVSEELSIGEEGGLEFSAAAIKDLNNAKGTDVAWSASGWIGNVNAGVYSDPTVGTEIAGTASYTIEVKEGVYIEPAVEAGKDTEGGTYIAVSPGYVTYETEKGSISAAPWIFVYPSEQAAYVGADITAEYNLTENASININVFVGDVTSPSSITATGGFTYSF